MRLYQGQIAPLAADVIRELAESEAIELEDVNEARVDIESVLKEYARVEREVTEEAKRRVEARGGSMSMLGRLKSEVAAERNLGVGEEMLPYLVDQIINMLFHSQNVAEVFAEDVDIRKTVTRLIRSHLDVDTALDADVRGKIKNLQEGTAAFEVEYARVMNEMKRRKGLV